MQHAHIAAQFSGSQLNITGKLSLKKKQLMLSLHGYIVQP